MKRTRSILIILVLAATLSAVPALGAARDSGPESTTMLPALGDGEIGAWFERALNDHPPWMLEVSADEETHLWDAAVYDDVHIRSYLYALEEVEVGQPLQSGMWDDALTMTYTFHMRDGCVKTFLFQEDRVCVDPQQNKNDVVYAVIEKEGMEYSRSSLEGLNRHTLAVEQRNAAEQERQAVRFEGDTLTLVLEESPSTGYLWSYAVEPEGVLVCVGDDYMPDESSLDADGAGGHRVFAFQTTAAGEALLVLTRRGHDGRLDHLTAFRLYADEKAITGLERVNRVRP